VHAITAGPLDRVLLRDGIEHNYATQKLQVRQLVLL
jgi:hypothetical protein